MTKRVAGLDVAKGLAIFLVVVGHIVAREDVQGAAWYAELKRLIYLFHMPLFMVLSGMAVGLSWRHREHMAEVASLVGRRVKRLMVPYLVFGPLIVVGKLLAGHFVHVDNPPSNVVDGIVAIVLYPMQSSSAFLWYLQLLSFYFLVVPWFLQLSSRWAPWVFLAIGIELQGHAWPQFLNLAGFVEYLPFFSGGILLGQHWQAVQEKVLKASVWPLWMVPFGAALAASHLGSPLPKWLVGALSVPFVLCAAQAVSGRLQKGLTVLGKQTLAIYLMNTIFIGLSKACLMFFVPWRDHYFILYFLMLGLAGLYLPIVTKRVLQQIRPSWAGYL